jgi:hypothetical protein
MCSSLGLNSEDRDEVVADEDRHRLKGKRRAACMGSDENSIIMVTNSRTIVAFKEYESKNDIAISILVSMRTRDENSLGGTD